jgi:hypothetical protein
MPSNHAGFEGIVTINGTDYHIEKWQATETTNFNPVTTTADYDAASGKAYLRRLGGVTELAGNFVFPYDSAINPVPALRSGLIVVNLILTMTTGHVITCPLATIDSYEVDQGGIDGVFKWTVNWHNQSIFTIT